MIHANYPDPHAVVAHVLASGALVSSMFGILPPILVAIGSVVGTLYYAISILESGTVQKFLARRRAVLTELRLTRLRRARDNLDHEIAELQHLYNEGSKSSQPR